MSTGFSQRRRGLIAATSALFVAAGIAAVGVAGAAQDVTVYSAESGGPCFTTTANKPACDAGEKPTVSIQTGEKVTWDFTYAPPNQFHNAAGANDVSGDPGWKTYLGAYNGTYSRTFNVAGTYEFKCSVHPSMTGTILVEGEPVEGTATPTATATTTATATATATPTFAATATATATPDDHLTTPRPGHAAKDAEAPRLLRASVKRVAAGTQVRFWLSEPATVSIALVRKGSKSSVASAVVQAPAGTRAFVLRAGALKRGTYTATLAPVDAMGNKGTAAVQTLRVK